MIDQEKFFALAQDGESLRLVEPHIYSAYPDQKETNEYDKMGTYYDLVVCSRLYNRLIWGYRTGDYVSFCRDALGSAADGWVFDAGCGSLAFSARAYAAYAERPIVLLDQSLTLLRMAKARLVKASGDVPGNMVFLHGNALELPFRPGSFKTILSLNLLHVLKDVKKALDGLSRVLADGGTLHCTTLIKNNRLADRYLELCGKMGIAIPRSADQLLTIFDELPMRTQHQIKGNMMFVHHG